MIFCVFCVLTISLVHQQEQQKQQQVRAAFTIMAIVHFALRNPLDFFVPEVTPGLNGNPGQVRECS